MSPSSVKGFSRRHGVRGLSFRQNALLLVERVTSAWLPVDYLDLFDPLRAGCDLRGRIVEVLAETADAVTVVIRPGADWAGHVPGQYVRVGVDVAGVRLWRAYSLTHGPRADGCICITVKAVPGGKVSGHLVEDALPGSLVQLEQAAGDFVLPAEGGRFLFVTAGSGVTPVVGMLRNLFPAVQLDRPRALDIVVVHVAPSEPDSIFAADLRALATAGLIRLVPRYRDQHGALDVDDLAVLVPDLTSRVTYACGPPGLLDALRRHHGERGLTLTTEQFQAPKPVVGTGGSVLFSRTGVCVTADGGTSILDAAEEAGVLMPSGCRMGICFGCVLPMREGAVRDLRNGEVTTVTPADAGRDAVLIQTCISAAAGACEIDH